MLSARSDRADIYLSGRSVAIRTKERHLLHGRQASMSLEHSLHAVIADLGPRSLAFRVWVGGSLCRLGMEPAILGANSIEDAEAALDALSQARNGKVLFAHRLGRWPQSTKSWLAAAVQRELVSVVQRSLGDMGHGLVSVKPWWSAVKDAHAGDAAMVDDESITVWRYSSGQVTQAMTISPVSDSPQRAGVIQRLEATGSLRCWQLDPARRANTAVGLDIKVWEGAHAVAL